MSAGKHTLLRSFLWLGSASAFARLVDLAAIAVVIGVVSPSQVGEAALAWTVITLCEPFASAGVQWAMLTVQKLDRRGIDSAFWMSLAGGVATAALVAGLAPVFAWIAHAPEVTPLIAVGSLKLLPVALASVPQQRLARVLRHREIASASAAATLLSALVRVVLALKGAGAWSFVIAHTSYSLFLLVALWLFAPYHVQLRVDWRWVRELWRAGMPSTLSQALVQWARNIDYLFVGAFLGVAPLGLYRVAFDLAMEPVVATGEVVARSATPTLRKLARSQDRLRSAFDYAMKLSLALALPLAAATFLFAPRLLELARDSEFAEASSATRWLVIAAVLRVLLGLYTPLAVAIGRPKLALRASLELFALLTVALLLCVWKLGSTLSIASAGVAWCAAVALSLAITRSRFRSVLEPPLSTAG
ncbi:MAG: oligosaccharide flippase family protein [Myxococcales bacterium]